MSRRSGVASVVAIGILATACNSSPPISSGAGNTLRADVLALTQAAADRKWSAADQALAQLRGDLTAAIAAGALSTDRAAAIRADVAAVAADLAAHRTANTPTTASSSTTAPKPTEQPKPPEPPKPPKDHHGHGNGHGHGHGGED